MTPSAGLPERARRLAGLSRSELARRAGASRPSLDAYAAGTKSPNLATAERIVRAAGFDLELAQRPDFREVSVGRGRCWWTSGRTWSFLRSSGALGSR